MTASASPVFPSIVRPFQLEGCDVRGKLVRLGSAYADILAPHDYPPSVARLLGELLALSAALSTSLKYDGTFTIQTSSNGPVRLIMADVQSSGGMRAYARYDTDALADALADANDGSISELLGSGHIAFTVDQGPDTTRYQGITAIEGDSLSDCANTYFHQSEQLETEIMLAAEPGGNGRDARAAALMLQRLPRPERTIADPEEDDEKWRTAVTLMKSMSVGELLDSDIPTDGLLYRLYHETGVRVFDGRPLRFQCRCSRERVANTLASFSADDLKDMKTDEGLIVATCEFCRTDYAFDDDQLADLRRAN
jgi:molecular chaperone Hsp33